MASGLAQTGVRETVFDDPATAALLLRSLSEGNRARLEKERLTLQQRSVDDQQKFSRLDAILKIGGPEAAAKAAIEMGLVPQGTQTPFQESQAALGSDEERAIGARRQQTGTGLLPSEVTSQERAAAGLEFTPVAKAEMALRAAQASGLFSDETVTQMRALGIGVPAGPTLEGKAAIARITESEARLKAAKAQVDASNTQRQALRLQVASSLSNGFAPTQGTTQDEFEGALNSFASFVMDGTPISSKPLRFLQSTSSAIEQAKLLAQMPPELAAQFELAKTLTDLVAAQKGRPSAATIQTLQDVFTKIMSHPRMTERLGETDGSVLSNAFAKNAVSKMFESAMATFFGPGRAFVPSPEIRKAMDDAIESGLGIDAGMLPIHRSQVPPGRLGASSDPKFIARSSPAQREQVRAALEALAAIERADFVAATESELTRVVLEGGDLEAAVAEVMQFVEQMQQGQ